MGSVLSGVVILKTFPCRVVCDFWCGRLLVSHLSEIYVNDCSSLKVEK